MGVTYIPNNKETEWLDVDFHGADVLGLIYAYARLGKRDADFEGYYRIPYEADEKTALKIRDRVKESMDNDLSGLTNYLARNGVLQHLDEQEEMNIYVKDCAEMLVKFMGNCRGYKYN